MSTSTIITARGSTKDWNQLIESLPKDPLTEGPVQCRERLGGMLSYYYREAA